MVLMNSLPQSFARMEKLLNGSLPNTVANSTLRQDYMVVSKTVRTDFWWQPRLKYISRLLAERSDMCVSVVSGKTNVGDPMKKGPSPSAQKFTSKKK